MRTSLAYARRDAFGAVSLVYLMIMLGCNSLQGGEKAAAAAVGGDSFCIVQFQGGPRPSFLLFLRTTASLYNRSVNKGEAGALLSFPFVPSPHPLPSPTLSECSPLRPSCFALSALQCFRIRSWPRSHVCICMYHSITVLYLREEDCEYTQYHRNLLASPILSHPLFRGLILLLCHARVCYRNAGVARS
jgi:hypothetical protein